MTARGSSGGSVHSRPGMYDVSRCSVCVAESTAPTLAYRARLVCAPRRFAAAEMTRDMDWKLELIVVPVSDVDKAKAFYEEQLSFRVDVDHRAGEDFRVVQLTPPGSACSIALMRNDAAGSLQGLHLVVDDALAAHAELTAAGVPVSDPYHFGASGQTPGVHPDRADYGTFLSFADVDGNGWLVQDVPSRRDGDSASS